MNPRQLFNQRRTAQAVIWLFAVLMVAFVAISGIDHGTAAAPATQASAGLAPSTGPVYADDKNFVGNYFTAVDGIDPDEAKQWEEARGGLDEGQWLPAYRWQNAFQMQSQPDGGFFGIGNLDESFLAGLSSLLFAIAGFLWTVLLGVTKWAFTTDLVDMLGGKINATAGGLTESFGSSGVIAIAVLLLMVTVATGMFRTGKSGGPAVAVRNIVLFIVPIAAMQLMATNVDVDGAKGDAGWDVSPVGLAERGSGVVNSIVTTVATPLTASPLQAPAKAAHKQASDQPNCEYYYARLYATYHGRVEEKDAKYEASLVLVSRMWEATMLRSFTEAQYGVYEEGRYAVCHQLESQRGTSAKEQSAVAGGDKSPYKKGGMKLSTTDEKGSVFGEASKGKHKIAYYLAWMACRGYDHDGAWPNAAKHDRLQDNDCEKWWDDGFAWDKDGGRFSPNGVGDDALTFDSSGDEGPAAKLGGTSTTEYQVVSTFMSGGGRFALSAASVATAAAYLVALGGLAIGTIVATILLALLLVFSPVTLLLLALPSTKGERNKIGMRMLRMTGTTLMAKLTFYLSITVMVILINMLNGLVV